MEDSKTVIRVMTIDDYDQVYALWHRIRGFGLRSVDDSREGIQRFLKRNPTCDRWRCGGSDPLRS